MKNKHFVKTSLAALALAGLSFGQQDWHNDRQSFFKGEGWHGHVFEQVRNDLNHIYTAGRASDKERNRLERTKQELTELQAKLDHGVFDDGTVNDVIDSLRKSANDDRLGRQDRAVLADDAARIHDYQRNHDKWMKR